MRLRDDRRLLTIAVRRVADQTGIPAAHVEKDFWLTEALRRMAAVADAERFTMLFKGGTSLSKAFRLIERFSEDVDVLVVLPTGSKGEQDRLLRRLIDEAAMGTNESSTSESTAASCEATQLPRSNAVQHASIAAAVGAILVETAATR